MKLKKIKMTINKPVCFSASRCGELLAGGSGKTRLNYIFELAEKKTGYYKDFTTNAMIHGIQSEDTAIDILINIYGGYANRDGKGGQVFFPINKYIGSTPDAIHDDWVADAKCQYYIHTYFEQCDKLSKKYWLQVQCQMMSLKVDKGYLINYLTKPEQFGEDDWQEYPIPLNQRYFIHEIKKDHAIQDEILTYAEKYYPYIDLCAEMLVSAEELDHDKFFGLQWTNRYRFVKLKDVDWQSNEKQVYLYDRNFYIIKN
jgi:hypothetical protein